MTRCDHCQPLILDHLYGLLDGPDADAVEAHLRECPACAALRAEEARVQGLFAKAAKGTFPQVRFEAPAARPAKAPAASAVTTPLAVPARAPSPPARRAGRVATWLPWGVAVAVLAAIPGTVVPVLGVLDRDAAARRDTAAATARIADARAEAAAATARVADAREQAQQAREAVDRPREEAARARAEAEQAHKFLLQKWADEEKKLLQDQTARKTRVEVLKPAALQPGAPNEFLLVVRDRGAAPNGRFLAEVRDQTDAVIFSQKLDAERRGDTHPIRLPADTWTKLTPQSELFLVVSEVDDKTGKATPLQDKVRLFGPVYATMLATDKPAYRPGETLFFRSLTLDRVTFRPPAREQILHYELRGPGRNRVRLPVEGTTDLVRVAADGKVEPITGPDGQPVRGVGTGAFALPADLPDGDYALTLRELSHPAGYPPNMPFSVTRTVKVRSGAADEYHKQIEFAGAASYAPGDRVEAWAELKFQNKPVAAADVIGAVVTADDAVVDGVAFDAKTAADGRANLRFTLPPELPNGDVRLKVTFRTPTGEESVADRVPVVGRNLVVEFFPEGGTLVAGVPCKVYVRATTPAGQPADVLGLVTDGRKAIATVETVTDRDQPGVNRGIGSFTYTPEVGTPVWLKLHAPAGVHAPLLDGPPPVAAAAAAGAPAALSARTGFPLPKPAIEGVVMTVLDPVTAPGEPIRVHLRSVGHERKLVVGAYTRGRLSDTQRVTAAPGQAAEVRLMAGTDPRGGVVRVTVFEEPEEVAGQPKPDLNPVAERLVFRKPGEALNLAFTTTGERAGNGPAAGYTAGSPAGLTVTATNEKGEPAAAVLYAAVVNGGVAAAPKDRLLTTHFLLAGEVNTPDDLEHADFLLTDHPKAAEALDRVLATQGWRRFVEQTPVPAGFARRLNAPTEDHANLQACNGQYPAPPEPPGLRDQLRLREVYWPRYQNAARKLDEARRAAERVTADRAAEQKAAEETAVAARTEDQAKATAAAAARTAREARATLDRAAAAAEPVDRFRGAGWYAVAGFGLLAVLLGAVALTRPEGRLPLGIGTVGSVGLVGFLVFALLTVEHGSVWAGEQVAKGDKATPPAPAQPTNEAESAPAAPRLAGIEPEAVVDAKLFLDADDGRGKVAASGGGVFDRPEVKPPTIGASGLGGLPPVPLTAPGHPGFGGFSPPGGMPGGPAGLGGGGPSGGAFGGAAGRPGVERMSPPGVTGGVTGRVPPPESKMAELKKDEPGRGTPKADRPTTPGSVPAPVNPAAAVPAMPTPGAPAGGAAATGPDGRPAVTPPAAGGPATPTALPPSAKSDGPPAKGGKGGGPGWVPKDRKPVSDDDLRTGKADPYSPATGIPGDRARLGAGVALNDVKLREELVRAREHAHDRTAFFWGTIDNVLGRPAVTPDHPVPTPSQDGGKLPRPQPNFDEIAARRIKAAVPAVAPLVVREYAAPRPGSATHDSLFAFGSAAEPDTVLWHPVIVLPSDGKATLPFTLGSAPGGYQVLVAGHTPEGRIGAVRGFIPVAPAGTSEAGPPVVPAGPAKP